MLTTFLVQVGKIMRRIASILYPFLFAVYPILALRNSNLSYVEAAEVVRPVLISLLATGLVWGSLRLLVGDWERAGLLTTLLMLLFSLYGHVFFELQSLFGENVRHRLVLAGFGAILVLGTWLIVAKLRDTRDAITVLSGIGFVLVGYSLLQSVRNDIANLQAAAATVSRNAVLAGTVPQAGDASMPDIYWILLDGHSRSDILRQYFDDDNSAFIRELENMGFYVASCSQSNYPSTKFSVISLMNANYLPSIPGVVSGLPPLYSSLVIQTVRSKGYSVIAFENRSKGHFELREDMRISRNQLAFGNIDLFGGLSEFETMLARTSLLRLIYDMPQLVPGLNPQILQQAEYYEHFQQVHFILDKLPDLPRMDRPRFVFTHILVPHQPYIFTPSGDFYWAADAVEGYRSNTQFIDARIVPTLKKIIEGSRTPPIIIVQGDHGSSIGDDPRVRMSILNAYYVDEATRADLYPTITPVNSFRIIFNHYFGTNYPILEDLSFRVFGEGRMREGRHPVPNTCVPST